MKLPGGSRHIEVALVFLSGRPAGSLATELGATPQAVRRMVWRAIREAAVYHRLECPDGPLDAVDANGWWWRIASMP